VRRIADRQLKLAIAGLNAGGDPESTSAIHTTRRRIKKVRALIRLVRRPLGDRYGGVNRRLRAVNRLLAPIADGQATVATLALVAERDGGTVPADVLPEIHATLLRREAMANEAAGLNNVLDTAAALLRAERDRVNDWELSATGFRAIAAGLERTARASRRAMAKATASSRSDDYHTWRQRVKDQWLQVRLLQARCGEALASDEHRLEDLDGLLGNCHNCAILRDVLTSDSTLDREVAACALRRVRLYERKLRRRACRLGMKVHRETPKQFVKRVRRLWRSARRTRRPTQRGMPWRSAA
jgi:CHAD domain-containing protein